MRVLILGVSTRAMVESAIRAGFRVTSLDYFADSDQPAEAHCLSLTRDFNLLPNLKNLARAAKSLLDDADAVAFASGVENEPQLAHLAGREKLLGNSPQTIEDIRNPQKISAALEGTGMQIPETISDECEFPSLDSVKEHAWLRKNLFKGAGAGVQFWNGQSRLRRGEILQRFINGVLASAIFLANGRHASLLGMTFQYAGVKALHARRFWWSGNVAPFFCPQTAHIIEKAARALTAKFGLVGINGIDFMISDGLLFLLEVNPRYTASVELFEMAAGINAFTWHTGACRGELPAIKPLAEGKEYWGKGILYAQQDFYAPDTASWQGRGIKDIPYRHEFIRRGAPVCSVLAHAASPCACWQAILSKAHMLEIEMALELTNA
ncbi:MAG: ATP-grasp domain-containing protein [Chloroflexi bacterium]|nr:ATP-grasp domain-containing protein [Chloroflexota bacterium]